MAKVKGGELTFILSDDGSLKLVEQKAKKTAGAMNKVGQTAHSADRSLKGAANASSGASKNFSKLSQGITGGLVPAYATLAANLFAVDALFRFLKSSADFRVLTQGQEAFAAATGVAYKSLAHDLQSATRNMINFRDAAQAGAIGRAAGLSAGQLTELSEAAFKVSMALGRDVTDSFNRLIRGVTKAEPELLDELGIVLRLEEATTKYAASLGLNKNQLSIYQKSQAVVNEVLDQAERKFGKINAIMEPNANSIAQLGVAFEKTIDSIRPFISALVEPAADFFSNNITAAAIAMGLFATTIISSVIPSHQELLIKQAEQTEAHEAQLDRLKLKTETLEKARAKLAKTPIAQEKFTKRMGKDGLDMSKLGGASGEALKAGKALTNKQIGVIKSQVTRGVGAFTGMTKQMKAKYTAMLTDMQGKTSVAQQKILLNWEGIKNGVQIKTTQMQIHWQRAMGVMAGATRTVTMAMTGLMSFMSYIGIAILIFQAGKAAYDKFFGPDQAQLDAFNDRIGKITESTKNLNTELVKMGEVARLGLLETVVEQVEHLGEAVASANLKKMFSEFKLLEGDKDVNPEAFQDLSDSLVSSLNALSNLDDGFTKYANTLKYTGTLTPKQIQDMRKMADGFMEAGNAAKGLREVQGELVKEQNRLVQSLPKIPYQNMLSLIETQIKHYKTLGDSHKAFAEEASTRLEYFNKLQERSIALQLEEMQLKKLQKKQSLGGAGTTSQELKFAQDVIKLRQEEYKIDDLMLQIKTSKLEKDSIARKGMEQQLVLAKENLEVLKMQATVSGLMSSQLFSTYNKAFTQVYTDFGAGIGKAIRGEEGAFDALGKNLKNTVSNAIGDALAKQFLDDVLPDGMKPANIAEEINKAGSYHAELVKNKIMQGGEHHANSLVGVANDMTKALASIQNKQNVARINVLKAEQGTLSDQRDKINKRLDTLRKQTSPNAIDNFVASSEGKRAKLDYARGQLSGDDLVEYNDRQKKLERLIARRSQLQMEAQDPANMLNGKAYYKMPNAHNQGGQTYQSRIALRTKEIEALLEEQTDVLDDLGGSFTKHLTDNIYNTKEDILDLENRVTGIDALITSKSVEEAGLQDIVDNKDTGNIKTVKKTEDYVPGQEDENPYAKYDGQGFMSDDMSEKVNQFGGVVSMLGAVAGEDEKVAKIMTVVAKLQMANALMERVNIAMQAKKDGLSFIGAFLGAPSGRQGGIMSKHARGYSQGGVADGPTAGYPAVLHGREAVVPLPNGRSIPVDMGKGAGGTNNVSINVNMAEGTTETVSDREEAKALGVAINQAVYQVLEKEQRQGGLLGG